jgi:putative transposase
LTIRKWRQKYGVTVPSELSEMKQLEEQNGKLKRLVADLSFDKIMLQDLLSKKAVKPTRNREIADELSERYRLGIRQACAALPLPRSVYSHRSTARDSTRLKARIGEIAATRVHYGYRRLHAMLSREGYKDNVKRIYRLYREQGLSLQHKRPTRNKVAKLRQSKTTAQHVNQMWSMDFVADNLFGKKLRMLTVVDCFTRESGHSRWAEPEGRGRCTRGGCDCTRARYAANDQDGQRQRIHPQGGGSLGL